MSGRRSRSKRRSGTHDDSQENKDPRRSKDAEKVTPQRNESRKRKDDETQSMERKKRKREFERGLSEEQQQQSALIELIISPESSPPRRTSKGPKPDAPGPSKPSIPGDLDSEKTVTKPRRLSAVNAAIKISAEMALINQTSLNRAPRASIGKKMTRRSSSLVVADVAKVEVPPNKPTSSAQSKEPISEAPKVEEPKSEDPKIPKIEKPKKRRSYSSKPKTITAAKTTIQDRIRSKTSNTLYHMPDEGLSEEDCESDTPDDLPMEEKLLKVPTMIVVDPSINSPKKYNDRIEIIQQFVPSIPKGCPEAIRGEKYGTWSRRKERSKLGEKYEGEWPGIPDIKYGYRDNLKMQQADRVELAAARNAEQRKRIRQKIDERAWIVQALFEDPNNPDHIRVLYEGWTSETMSAQQADETDGTAPKIMEIRRVRETFLEKVRDDAEAKARDLVASEGNISYDQALSKFFVNPNVSSLGPTSRFWLYRDMEYFHTKQQEDHLLGPIWYMSLTDPEQPPPRYAYTSVNIVDKDAFDKCLAADSNLPTKELIEKFYTRHFHVPGIYEACSKPNSCKCNRRFTILYGRDSGRDRRGEIGMDYQPVRNLKYDSNGLLNLDNFSYADLRVVMECSDECGCGHECPKRRLQQGQSKPMVVTHEGEKGFGLRAAEGFKKGELVCEYTGTMFIVEPPMRRQVEPFAHEIMNEGMASEDSRSRRSGLRAAVQRKEEVKKEKKSSVKRGRGRPSLDGKKKESKKEPMKEVRVEEKIEEKEENPKKKLPKRNTSYQAGCSVMNDELVICAEKAGNIARFINHSCQPNTAFFEVHSRRYVTDPLIPRVAVYATKDIALGEEITVAYWNPEVTRTPGGLPCRCGATNCMKFLPS